jgi:hypothetical protein
LNSTALFFVVPAASVFAFKTPTFDINKFTVASLDAVPFVTSAICCWALSHACNVILLATLFKNHQLHFSLLSFGLISPRGNSQNNIASSTGSTAQARLAGSVVISRSGGACIDGGCISSAECCGIRTTGAEFGDGRHGGSGDGEGAL